MQFLLEVAMADAALTEDPAGEPGRIPSYRGGDLHHCALTPGDGSVVYDWAYREVGRWSVADQAG